MDNALALLSTDAVPASHRLPFWRDLVCDAFVELGCEANENFDRERFYGRIGSKTLAGIRYSQVASTSHMVRRDKSRIARSNAEHFLVSLQIKGKGILSQDGRITALEPGDFALYDVTRPYDLLFEDDFEQLVIQIPRAQIVSRLFDADNLTAIGVSGRTGVGRLASMLIAQTADQLEVLDSQSLGQVQASTLDLMAHALANVSGKRSERITESQELTIRRVLRYIDDELSDPGLTCQKVALENGLSERYLRKLFEAKGHGVAEWIWQRRLERARLELIDPRSTHRSITSIAYDWGFKDSAHFSRAFKQRFDMTPSEMRKAKGHAV